jgi:hypothetical protein
MLLSGTVAAAAITALFWRRVSGFFLLRINHRRYVTTTVSPRVAPHRLST